MSHPYLDNPPKAPGIEHPVSYFAGSLQYLERPSFLLQQLSQVLDIEGVMMFDLS